MRLSLHPGRLSFGRAAAREPGWGAAISAWAGFVSDPHLVYIAMFGKYRAPVWWKPGPARALGVVAILEVLASMRATLWNSLGPLLIPVVMDSLVVYGMSISAMFANLGNPLAALGSLLVHRVRCDASDQQVSRPVSGPRAAHLHHLLRGAASHLAGRRSAPWPGASYAVTYGQADGNSPPPTGFSSGWRAGRSRISALSSGQFQRPGCVHRRRDQRGRRPAISIRLASTAAPQSIL